MDIDYSHLGLSDLYDLLRVAISHVVAHCAVPIFFLISGYLFFSKLQDWNIDIWKDKIKSRFRTIIFPYFIWVSIAIVWNIMIISCGCLLKGNSWINVTNWLSDNGWLHLYWDSNTWNLDRINMLGWQTPSSAPCLIPFWFMRDLILVIASTPLIFLAIKHLKLAFIFILLCCYIIGVWIPVPGFSSTATLFFSVGAYIMVNKLDLVIVFKKFRYLFYTLFIALFPFMIFFDGHNTEIGDLLYPYFVIAMCGIMINIVATLVKKGKLGWCMRYSNTTFFIFASHIFLLPYIKIIVCKLTTAWGYGEILPRIFSSPW